MPRLSGPLQALDGDYYLISTDVLARTMSFSTVQNAPVGNIVLSASRVREIAEMNRRGKKVDTILSEGGKKPNTEEIGFTNVVEQESITRFDKKKRPSSGRNRKFRKPNGKDNKGAREGKPKKQN